MCRRITIVVSSLLVALSLAATATAAPNCGGQARTQFSCASDHALGVDAFNWAAIAGVDAVPLEISIPVGLANPSLRRFWQLETAAAAARGTFEFFAVLPGSDPNFEATPTPLAIRTPVIRPAKVVTRAMAGLMTRLLGAEALEVANLDGLDVALDRATAAQMTYNRPDWAGYQLSLAAGFARHVAAALGRELPLQRALSAALVRRRLLIGLGMNDVRRAKRHVRRFGLAPALRRALHSFGITSTSGLTEKILSVTAGPSISLARELAAPTILAAERASAKALQAFAASIPAHPRPTSA